MADRLFVVEKDRIYSVKIIKETEKTYVTDITSEEVIWGRKSYYIKANLLKSQCNVFSSEVDAWKYEAGVVDKSCEWLTRNLQEQNEKRMEIHKRLKQAQENA